MKMSDFMPTIDQLKDLKTHCNDLAKFLYHLEHLEITNRYKQWTVPAEWLEVASGIKKITFDVASYDKGYGWCGHADDYTDKRDNLLQIYVTEVGIFNFIWGSLEAIIEIIDPPELSSTRGKINKACNYINLNFHYNLPCYLDLLNSLYKCFSIMFRNLKKEFKLKPHINISGIALYAIYKVRNRLAHGALRFPTLIDMEDIIEENYQIELIRLCSRLVLLSIQMLLISFFKNQTIHFKLDLFGDIDIGFPDDSDKKITLDSLLRSVHLEYEEDTDQIEFDFIV